MLSRAKYGTKRLLDKCTLRRIRQKSRVPQIRMCATPKSHFPNPLLCSPVFKGTVEVKRDRIVHAVFTVKKEVN